MCSGASSIRNQVTSFLTAITVIIVGVVNCFFGGCNEARSSEEDRDEGGSGRWSLGLNCQSRLWLGGTDVAMWEMDFMPVDSAVFFSGMCEFAAERQRRTVSTDIALCTNSRTEDWPDWKCLSYPFWFIHSFVWCFFCVQRNSSWIGKSQLKVACIKKKCVFHLSKTIKIIFC